MAGLSISLSLEILQKLEEVSKEYDLPKSFIIKKALENYFKELKENTK